MIRRRAAGWIVLATLAAVFLSPQSPTAEPAAGVLSRHAGLHIRAVACGGCLDDSSWGGRVQRPSA